MKLLRLLTFAVFALFTGMAASAQNNGPEDITNDYLQNADLSTIDSGWDYYSDNYKYQQWRPGSTDVMTPAVEFYSGWSGLEHTDFKFSQTITLPPGDYRIAVNAFFRNGDPGDGTNNGKAWIFAGDNKKNVGGLVPGGLKNWESAGDDMDKARTAFKDGAFSNAFDFSLEEETTIELGFQGKFDAIRQWCILGPLKLYKYSLDDYLVDYRAKVAEAEALYDSKMNANVLSDLQAAVLPEASFNLGREVLEAINNLNEKITAANSSISEYAATKAAFNEFDQKAANLDADGLAAYNAVVDPIKAAYNNGSMTGNQAETVKAAYQNAIKQQTAVGTDITVCAPTSWVGQTGNYGSRAERYNALDRMPYEYDGDVMTQTIEGLPKGAVYKVTLEATASFTSGRGFECKTGDGLAAVFANNTNVNLPVIDRGGVGDSDYGPYEVIGKVGNDGVLKYGIKKLDPLGGNWFVVNLLSIVKVEYVPVESIEAENVEVEIGSTAEIGATVTPSNATLPGITYASADETIATVDANGVVTGVAVGETTITITADEVSKTINVNVVAPAILPESISLEPATIDLKIGGSSTIQIIATVNPSDANQEVIFASSDESVATVDALGNVTAVGIGSATITVTSAIKDDVAAIATVNVTGADVPAVYSSVIENETDYWLMNAATGLYLGGANDWGTRASIIEHGIPFKFIEAPNGLYNLDSYTSNGGDSHFLAGEWIDGNATGINFIANANGTFSIKIGDYYLKAKTANTEVDLNGTDENDAFAQWYLISKNDWLAMLEDASESNPVDATFFIKDYNFSRNNQMFDSWETTHEGGNFRQGQEGRPSEGDQFNWNMEGWHSTFSVTQTLIVPNGTYRLTAQGFYEGTEAENPPYFFANDQKQTFPVKTGSENSMHTAAVSFSAGLYTIDPITVTVTDHTLTIGAKNEVSKSLWCIWDNFNLEMIDCSESQDISVNVGPLEYATLYYGKLDLSIPEGVTASIVESVDNRRINLVELNDVIPAGTGVVLQATTGTYDFPVLYDSEESSVDNMLLGTDEETTIEYEAGSKYYILSALDDVVGFYLANRESSFTNGAHKAYLVVPESEQTDGVNAYVFHRTDGILNVDAEKNVDPNVYTISGIRVDGKKLAKGLYIVDGKKIIIK